MLVKAAALDVLQLEEGEAVGLAYVVDLHDIGVLEPGDGLRLAQAGVFDGMSFHRVVKGFAVQTGSIDTRGPLNEKQQKLVRNLQPEFNDVKHARGIVSMARGDDPASASTSFFLVTADAPTLDGKYTAFGRVIEGLEVLDKIEGTAVNGEAPVDRIGLKAVMIQKNPGQ